MSKILLIDGNSIMNRGFYGLPDLTNKKGQHTNAILGFLNIFFKCFEDEQPDHVAVAFDLHAPTFRHKMFEDYKGTRKSMADELREQFPVMKELLGKMNITIVEKEGFEADDVLGTLSRMALAAGFDVTILSGDRDLLQLATEQVKIRIPKTKAGVTVIEEYYAKDVQALYQVTPIEFIDMKGLMGDTSDNIPGVPGIGEKTASKIIQQFHSIENALIHIAEVKPDKARKSLDEFRDQAIMSKVLATIKLDVPIEQSVEDMDISMDKMLSSEVEEMFTELEFKSLLKRFTFAGKKKEKFSPSVTEITDMEEMYNLFAKIKGVVGVYPVILDGDLNRIFLAYSDMSKKETKQAIVEGDFQGVSVYEIPIQMFITEDAIKSELRSLVNKQVVLSFMNFKQYIDFFGFTEESPLFDCKVAAYLLNPLSSSYEYDVLDNIYLDITVEDEKTLLGKEEWNAITVMESNIRQFCAHQAFTAFMLYDILNQKLSDKNMRELYYDLEIPCEFCLHEMEVRGIRTDRVALENYGEALAKRIDELTALIYTDAGEEFNINSTKQLGVLLFEKLGLKSGKKTKTGYSTSQEVLEKIRDEHPIIPKILEYRQLSKLKSTYVEGLGAYIQGDGRIHGKFNQTITATGRISSTEPNLQNIPMRAELGREIRKVFIPEDGYIFLDADYSQIELRVLAHLSDDDTLIKAYQSADDIHAITASEVFGVPLDQVDGTLRRKAKAVNFGIVYGISSFGLGQDLSISRKEAQEYIDKYFKTYQGVKVFLDTQVEEAKKNGVVTTMFHRLRPVPELSSSNFMTRQFGERVAMNSPIQGTAADIIKIAMVRVNMELKSRKLKSRLILQIHDELLIETAIDELEEVKEIMSKEMMHAADLKIPLVIDMHTGSNLFDAK